MSYIPSHAESANRLALAGEAEKGCELADSYRAASPFPHVVIDDFLDDRLIEQCLREFPERPGCDSETFDRAQERNKTSYHPDYLPSESQALFYAFNARPFIRVIENITGINGLLPDPHFYGGGFHEIANGGHLSVHADFVHHRKLNLERRVNVLIYLNKDWRAEYGGQLELWSTDMSECVHSVVPVANRCVIFTTTESSMHGNPAPVAHPDNVSRKSIALYYYTATWDGSRPSRTTQFRPRAGSADKTDWRVRARELAQDLTPPILTRQISRSKTKNPGNPGV